MTAPWWGNLLDWAWDPEREMHTAWHGGRSHFITKVDRRTADAQGGGMSRGWHIWDDNPHREQNRWDGFGPGLGRTVAVAKRAAEAWILCPYMDMMGYPKLSIAISHGETEYNRSHIDLDAARRLYTVGRDGAAVEPLFEGPAGVMVIRWRAYGRGGVKLAEFGTWAEAVKAVVDGPPPHTHCQPRRCDTCGWVSACDAKPCGCDAEVRSSRSGGAS